VARASIDIEAGVIEGFFGRDWGWPARLAGIDFLREFGYRLYVYAPKADAYLRRRWREPLPAETLEGLSALGSRCRERGVDFGVGLTPFEIYLDYDAAARLELKSKVLQINETGADTLCILFDDMRGDVADLAQIQSRVIGDVSGWSDADRFIVCPTYYSYDARLAKEFGPPPKTYLEDFGRQVDPAIDFFWTGEKVISHGYSVEHLAEVASVIRRKPFIWDNHSSNDSKIRTNHLYLDPGEWSLAADYVAGLAVNPMNQPHLSRIALAGYHHLLTAGRGLSEVFPSICRKLCGDSLGARVAEHAALFKDKRLDELDAPTRAQLLAVYEREAHNAFAAEIAAWLRGEYVFDPQCLTS
jgi:hyaluronoglucosaminidase